MRRADRLFQIVQYFRGRRLITAGELGEHLERRVKKLRRTLFAVHVGICDLVTRRVFVQTSIVVKSIAASTSQCVLKIVAQIVCRRGSGAGSMPCALRTLPTVVSGVDDDKHVRWCAMNTSCFPGVDGNSRLTEIGGYVHNSVHLASTPHRFERLMSTTLGQARDRRVQ